MSQLRPETSNRTRCNSQGAPAQVAGPGDTPAAQGAAWAAGIVDTPAGPVPRVRTALDLADRLGSWKARWGVGRMRYRVEPGLYAVGDPTQESPVFLSANYKMSFDRLRSALAGRDGWIVVLDTRGINVWCAAGAGTFGTDEIVRRAAAVRLGEVVSHRRLVVPQLGAPGVAAHEVRRLAGFEVVYGPVRAADLGAFLDAGMKATDRMRSVRFDFADRIVLAPVEMVMAGKYALLAAACLFILAGLGRDGYSTHRAATVGAKSAALLLGAGVAGVVATVALLPWLPGRALSAKGAWVGAALALALAVLAWTGVGVFENPTTAAAWVLVIPAVISFLAMNFTGATPYTSLSGVLKEMRFAVPAQIACAVAGAALWIVGRFV